MKRWTAVLAAVLILALCPSPLDAALTEGEAPAVEAPAPATAPEPAPASEPAPAPDPVPASEPEATAAGPEPASEPAAQASETEAPPAQTGEPDPTDGTAEPEAPAGPTPESETPPPAGEEATPEPTAEAAETPEPTAEAPASGTEEAVLEPLSVRLDDISRYGVVGYWVHATALISGGTAPYALDVNGQPQTAASAGAVGVSAQAKKKGELVLRVCVTDAAGQSAAVSWKIPISTTKRESSDKWARSAKTALTGEWAADLIAVAETQLGYEESKENFIITDDGRRQGYTRYGDWYGLEYEEWCAMFISFCASYAGLTRDGFPKASACVTWRNQLSGYYHKNTKKYTPQAGDLVFFHHNRPSIYPEQMEPDYPNHVGIVTRVSGSTIYSIEGNSNASVRERVHSRWDEEDKIIAFLDMTSFERSAKGIREEAREEVPEVTAFEPARRATVLAAGANVWPEPSDGEEAVALTVGGESLEALGFADVDGVRWLRVRLSDSAEGWMRGSDLELDREGEEDQETAEAAAAQAAEALAATTAPDDAAETVGADGYTAKLRYTAVNMREEPTTQSGCVIKLTGIGTEVTVVGTAEGEGGVPWMRVECGEYSGWIRGDLIEPAGSR